MATMQERPPARVAHDALVRSRTTVDPAMRAAVDTLPPEIRRIAGYHFGWWDEHGQPDRANSGKALRPALVLLTAEAVGGPPGTPHDNGSVAEGGAGVSSADLPCNAALPAAVAVELVHNFSLLHDDVMDGDVTRRHRRTAWTVFGSSAAILAGDSLLTLAINTLAGSGHPAAADGIRAVTTAVQALLGGQSADLDFENRTDVSLAECLAMVRAKTGALLGCSCALGAYFGGGTPDQIHHLRSFGEQLGIAFQHMDDLLGIWGDPAITGKPVFSDLHTRKKSLPVVAALTSGTPAGNELATLYHQESPLTEADLARAATLIDTAGGRTWSHTQADHLLTQALYHLQATDPTPRAAGELTALARLATQRDH